MQASSLFFESKVDRILIGFGLGLAFLASTLLFLNNSELNLIQGIEPIGTVSTLKGVQRRHSRALSWSSIQREGKLYPKDMVYTPADSAAEVFLNTEEKLILEPESMVEFDSVNSGTFKIVLVQGTAKILSKKTKEIKNLVEEVSVVSVVPQLKRPTLPLFFVDVPSWQKKQEELFSSLQVLGDQSGILPEQGNDWKSLELKSLNDFALKVGPPQVRRTEDGEVWYLLRWSSIPLSGVAFEIEVSREEDFKRTIRQDSLKNRTLEIQLLDPGKYFWRVKASQAKNHLLSDVGTLLVEKDKVK